MQKFENALTAQEKYVLKVACESWFRSNGHPGRSDRTCTGIISSVKRDLSRAGRELTEDYLNEVTVKVVYAMNSLRDKGLVVYETEEFYNGSWWKEEALLRPLITLKEYDEKYA